MKIAVITLAILLAILGFFAMFIWSGYSTAKQHESSLVAVVDEMKNVYANSIIQVLKTKGKVTTGYKKDLVDVIDANMARYKDDKNLMFKSVAESAGLTLDASLYKDLSKAVETGYGEFSAKQSDQIDRVRVYKNFLDTTISGKVTAVLFNFPSPEAKKAMGMLILNKDTEATFESKQMEVVDPFATETTAK
jgi:hypothetical protein